MLDFRLMSIIPFYVGSSLLDKQTGPNYPVFQWAYIWAVYASSIAVFLEHKQVCSKADIVYIPIEPFEPCMHACEARVSVLTGSIGVGRVVWLNNGWLRSVLHGVWISVMAKLMPGAVISLRIFFTSSPWKMPKENGHKNCRLTPWRHGIGP